MVERQSNLVSLGSDPVVEVTTFETKRTKTKNAQSFYSKKSLCGKHFLFHYGPARAAAKLVIRARQLIEAGDSLLFVRRVARASLRRKRALAPKTSMAAPAR
jgi:hypothetical protein